MEDTCNVCGVAVDDANLGQRTADTLMCLACVRKYQSGFGRPDDDEGENDPTPLDATGELGGDER